MSIASNNVISTPAKHQELSLPVEHWLTKPMSVSTQPNSIEKTVGRLPHRTCLMHCASATVHILRPDISMLQIQRPFSVVQFIQIVHVTELSISQCLVFYPNFKQECKLCNLSVCFVRPFLLGSLAVLFALNIQSSRKWMHMFKVMTQKAWIILLSYQHYRSN